MLLEQAVGPQQGNTTEILLLEKAVLQDALRGFLTFVNYPIYREGYSGPRALGKRPQQHQTDPLRF